MSDTTRNRDATPQFIADDSAARAALSPLLTETLVGLDTETFWEPATRLSRMSLFQVATRAGDVFVIDALAVDPEILRPLVESPAVSMAAHNARFDEMVLAGAGLRPAALVDTLSLSRSALTLQSYSLASVAEHLFGVALDKTLRTSNWRRRPLTKAQILYAALDARMSLRVYDELSRLLREEGRLELALRAATLRPRADDAQQPRRRRRAAPDPGPPLTKEEKRVVRELKSWRLSRANEQRLPAYMICQDRTLEHLARERPQTLEALRAIHGLGDSKIERYGAELLRALAEACGETQHKEDPPRDEQM